MDIVVYVISISLCGLIQGIFSFGGGIFVIPILSLFFDLKQMIIPVLSLYNIFTNSYTYANYKSVNIFKYKKLLLFGIIGNIVGSTLAATYISTNILKMVIAIVVIIKVTMSKILPKYSFSQHQFLAGFSSGILGGLLSLGNLGLAILYGKNKKDDFKSLVASFCLIQNIFTFFIYLITKRYTFNILLISIMTIAIGYFSQKIGIKLSNKMPNSFFVKILDCYLLIISIYLLISSLQ